MVVSILGCGWYGLALAKGLVARGETVMGSTTSAEKLTALETEGIAPFLIDLSVDIATQHVAFFNCDVLVIAIPPKSRSGEGGEYLPKLQRIIHAIHQHQIKKVILISSTGVYADLSREVDELTDPQPDTASGKILFEAEALFREQTDFKTTIIRFGGLIGPGRDPGRFFAGKKNIPNGLAPVNMIHLDDCIGVTIGVLDKDAFGYTFNSCTPHHSAKAEFYTRAAERSGLELPEFIPELKEWKLVTSVKVNKILGYSYLVTDWDNWLSGRP